MPKLALRNGFDRLAPSFPDREGPSLLGPRLFVIPNFPGFILSSVTLANSPYVDWAVVEREYAAMELTTQEICLQHGITQSALYHRVRINGWPLRQPDKLRRPKTPSAKCAHRNPGEAAMARRLLTALDRKMTEFENRIAEPGNAADSERDARTLGTLVRLFDKLTALGDKRSMARKNAASAKAANSSAGKDAHDADRLRLDLARRLEKLRGGIGG